MKDLAVTSEKLTFSLTDEDRKGRTERGHRSYGKFPLMVWLYLMTEKTSQSFF